MSIEKEDIFIDGGDVYLRLPIAKDLEGLWYTWLNDPFVTKYQNKGIFPNTSDMQREYWQSMLKSSNDVIFAIISKEDAKHIGSVGLHKIDWVHRSAELGIIIGEKEYWKRGYGKKVWYLITEYGFKVLNLHRIYAIIMTPNISSIKCAEYVGFKKEGEIRDGFFKIGTYLNISYYNILSDDFDNNVHKGSAQGVYKSL